VAAKPGGDPQFSDSEGRKWKFLIEERVNVTLITKVYLLRWKPVSPETGF
jgi:hypothetical protein